MVTYTHNALVCENYYFTLTLIYNYMWYIYFYHISHAS